MSRPVFAAVKNDEVFLRIFGSEAHAPVQIGLLNDVLGLDRPHRIASVPLQPPDKRPKVPGGCDARPHARQKAQPLGVLSRHRRTRERR